MLDVFTIFKTTPYTFVKYGQGGIYGNTSLQEWNAEGVFKLRRGVSNTALGENATSTATLHIKPSETFLSGLTTIEGHGIKVNDLEYRIVGVTEGMNYSTNVLEHITLTLQVEEPTDV